MVINHICKRPMYEHFKSSQSRQTDYTNVFVYTMYNVQLLYISTLIAGVYRVSHKLCWYTYLYCWRVFQCSECPMFSQASPLWTHRGSIGYTSRSHFDDNDKYDDDDDGDSGDANDGGTDDDDEGGTDDDDDGDTDDADDGEKVSIWGDCKAVSRAQASKGIRAHSQLVSSQSDN